MAAVILDLRDAVVAELNSPARSVTWSQTFTAAAKYLVRNSRSDLAAATWYVSVLPAEETDEVATRDLDFNRVLSIDIGIQKVVNPDVIAQGDAVLNLAEEFLNYWLGQQVVTMPHLTCLQFEKQALYIPKHLDENMVATAVNRLHFEGLA